ncbi:MAG: hypothetical protein U0359_15920 [Byssovorax sp.]
MRSAFLGLLLLLALLPATLRGAEPLAWSREGRSSASLVPVAVALRAVQERAERTHRDPAELREQSDRRAPGAGPLPIGTAHAVLPRALPSPRRPIAQRATLAQGAPPPSPARDQRVTIRRCRASSHIPHTGDEGPPSAAR